MSLSFPEFQQQIFAYYSANQRSFPWRETHDPYAITVSEIMLQQTQADRVIPKYLAFLKALPNWKALANVETAELLRLWQGLGYNRRALALKKMAEVVQTEYAGQLPKTKQELVALPGIGPYTASAILAFAYNDPTPMIETNIRRVYIHAFFPTHETVHDADLMPLIEGTLDRENPREWYYALMDYGAYLAKEVPNPNRRSRQYVKQGALKGSNREVRGAILRILTKGFPRSFAELADETGIAADRLPAALAQLQKERFIVENAGVFTIS